MKRIILTKHIGFCSGVRRAVELAFKAAKEEKIYSLGPLIHNPQEVKRLEKAGVKVINSLGNLKRGTLIVRSHGLPEKTIRAAKRHGLKIIDATCPLVKKVQNIARQLKREGYLVVMVGDRYHPEVKAVKERAGRKFMVISGEKKPLINFPRGKIGILAQTTQSEDNFLAAVSQLKKAAQDIKVFNTICRETARRQKGLLDLVREVNVILVIGGFNSANTRRLVELSREAKMRTYYLESVNDLKKVNLKGVKKIGIITGASTPDWIVEELVKELNAMPRKS
ncbi:MAG: 4-hydroxy-3-methylbut-2-enyl diphosphate reductase [Candidatus Ratteibacteria bacterium]|nr:4-hydroxy-3-methylbut-2-enyl diphosphate reductase [Candidatus Ratteibacteria bacterium]